MYPRKLFHTRLTIFKIYHHHHMRATYFPAQLLLLLGIHLARNTDMPTKTFINIVHKRLKHSPMSRSIFDAVVGNVIMNHLMNDDILNLPLRQVNSLIYAQLKIVILRTTKQSLFLPIRTSPQKSFCTTQHNRQHRQPPLKHQGIKLPKLLLYIRYSRYQGEII